MKRDADHYGNTARKLEPMDELPLFGGEPAPLPGPTHVVAVVAHTRRIPGESPPSGAQLRDAALAEHEADDAKRVAIEYVRAELAALYQERVTASRWTGKAAGVNADDVDAVLAQWPQCPRLIREIPGLWKGAVFRGGLWEVTGDRVHSTRPHMRATELPMWRLRAQGQERAS